MNDGVAKDCALSVNTLIRISFHRRAIVISRLLSAAALRPCQRIGIEFSQWNGPEASRCGWEETHAHKVN